MIFEFREAFLNAFYYSEQNDNLFQSLLTASIFIHCHSFLLKILFWAIFDDATDQNKLFKSPFPSVRYLINFTCNITKTQNDYLIKEVISFIDMYELDAESPSDPLSDRLFKQKIIELFWETLLQIAKTFPKSLFDICYELNVYSVLNQQKEKACANPAKFLLMSEVIIPSLFDNLRKVVSKNQKDYLNFVIKSITSNNNDEYSRIGFKPLDELLDFLS